MKVRMRVGISGTRNGQDWPPPGGVLDVDDAEGAQLCAGGLAEPVAEPDADVELAVMRPPVETRSVEPRSAMDELTERATRLGIKVDGRWSIARLREEIAKVEKTTTGPVEGERGTA